MFLISCYNKNVAAHSLNDIKTESRSTAREYYNISRAKFCYEKRGI